MKKLVKKGGNILKSRVKLTTIEQIKAYSDPYRLKMITYLRNRNEEATVKQIADYLGELPAKVHYHMKKLEKAGIVEIIRTQEIKGIIAKYYYLTAEIFEIIGEEIQEEAKQVYKSQVLNLVNDYYEKSKEKSIEALVERIDKGEEHKSLSIVYRDIYVTEEEFGELNSAIIKLVSKYDTKGPGKLSCHVFSAMARSIEDEVKDNDLNMENEAL